MKLKVCGVRSQIMAQACQDLLVDYIGLNFVPSSKRKVSATLAQKLSHAFTGKKVGVFMNQSIKEILETISVVDLDVIQLHGQESPEFINQLKKSFPGLSYWKAFPVTESFDSNILQEYSKNCEKLLFDGQSPGNGNKIMNTHALSNAIKESQRLNISYALAGGINPETLPSLMQNFPETQIFDTASGIETNGEFDYAKLKKIMAILKFEL